MVAAARKVLEDKLKAVDPDDVSLRKGRKQPKKANRRMPRQKAERIAKNAKDPKYFITPGHMQSHVTMSYRVREAVLIAANLCGRDGKGTDEMVGYLAWLARAEPSIFARMLMKIMPTQIEVDDTRRERMTPEEAAEKLRSRGIPVPPLLIELEADRVAERVPGTRADPLDKVELDTETRQRYNIDGLDNLDFDEDDE